MLVTPGSERIKRKFCGFPVIPGCLEILVVSSLGLVAGRGRLLLDTTVSVSL